MFISGLTSITFRNLTVEKIIAMVKKAGLEAIEWGGDVHVPHGNIETAASVRQQCDDAGIVLPSYGSYYRAGSQDEKNPDFSAVLLSAMILGVKTIRVWAGNKGSAEADAEYRKAVAGDLMRISGMSAQIGISISLEFHGGTLTDTRESTLDLIAALPENNIKFYWQPPLGNEVADNLETIDLMISRISNVHVFQWTMVNEAHVRMPLSDGIDCWTKYFAELENMQPRVALIEFVKDDSEEQFYQDAATLRKLLKKS